MIVVTVEHAFQHCPKALVRSDLWRAGSGARPKGVPTLGDFAAARTPAFPSQGFFELTRMPAEAAEQGRKPQAAKPVWAMLHGMAWHR